MKINNNSAFAAIIAVLAMTTPAKAAGVFYAFGFGLAYEPSDALGVSERYFNVVDTVYAPADVSGSATISSSFPASLSAQLGQINTNQGGSLLLRDAAGKIYYNGNDTGNSVSLFWRIYENSTSPGAFTAFNTTLQSTWNPDGNTNRYFRGTASTGNVNLLNGLASGTVEAPRTYTLEIYGMAGFSYSGGTFDLYQSNGGNNFKTEIQLVPEPSSASLMALGVAGLLALRRRRNA
jgi:hypothetical protein